MGISRRTLLPPSILSVALSFNQCGELAIEFRSNFVFFGQCAVSRLSVSTPIFVDTDQYRVSYRYSISSMFGPILVGTDGGVVCS